MFHYWGVFLSSFFFSSSHLSFRASRGFCNGLFIYSCVPAVMSIIRRQRIDGKTWRTAVACGFFLGGYRLVSQFLWKNKHLRKLTEHLTDRERNFIAGACGAGFGLATDDHFLVWFTSVLFRFLLIVGGRR